MKTKKTSRPRFNDDFYGNISDIAAKEVRNSEKRAEALRGCVKKLSLHNQKLISFRFEQGVSVKKMARLSGLSADALYKKISRIYSTLNDCVHRTMLQWERI